MRASTRAPTRGLGERLLLRSVATGTGYQSTPKKIQIVSPAGNPAQIHNATTLLASWNCVPTPERGNRVNEPVFRSSARQEPRPPVTLRLSCLVTGLCGETSRFSAARLGRSLALPSLCGCPVIELGCAARGGWDILFMGKGLDPSASLQNSSLPVARGRPAADVSWFAADRRAG